MVFNILLKFDNVHAAWYIPLPLAGIAGVRQTRYTPPDVLHCHWLELPTFQTIHCMSCRRLYFLFEYPSATQLKSIRGTINISNRGELVGHKWRSMDHGRDSGTVHGVSLGHASIIIAVNTLQWFTRGVPLKTHPSWIVYPLVTHRCCAGTHFKVIFLLEMATNNTSIWC